MHQRTFQALMNVMAWGTTIEQAIDAPDFFLPSYRRDQGFVVNLPRGRFPLQVVAGLGLAVNELADQDVRLGGEGVWVP